MIPEVKNTVKHRTIFDPLEYVVNQINLTHEVHPEFPDYIFRSHDWYCLYYLFKYVNLFAPLDNYFVLSSFLLILYCALHIFICNFVKLIVVILNFFISGYSYDMFFFVPTYTCIIFTYIYPYLVNILAFVITAIILASIFVLVESRFFATSSNFCYFIFCSLYCLLSFLFFYYYFYFPMCVEHTEHFETFSKRLYSYVIWWDFQFLVSAITHCFFVLTLVFCIISDYIFNAFYFCFSTNFNNFLFFILSYLLSFFTYLIILYVFLLILFLLVVSLIFNYFFAYTGKLLFFIFLYLFSFPAFVTVISFLPLIIIISFFVLFFRFISKELFATINKSHYFFLIVILLLLILFVLYSLYFFIF